MFLLHGSVCCWLLDTIRININWAFLFSFACLNFRKGWISQKPQYLCWTNPVTHCRMDFYTACNCESAPFIHLFIHSIFHWFTHSFILLFTTSFTKNTLKANLQLKFYNHIEILSTALKITMHKDHNSEN